MFTHLRNRLEFDHPPNFESKSESELRFRALPGENRYFLALATSAFASCRAQQGRACSSVQLHQGAPTSQQGIAVGPKELPTEPCDWAVPVPGRVVSIEVKAVVVDIIITTIV
jgi:hypothetical protein